MSDEIDPEVLGDLRLRVATEYDSSRTRGEGTYNWKQPDMVGAWPCRFPGCAQLVGVDEDTMAQLAQFNGYLRKRKEAPIDINQILMCPKHEALFKQERSYRLHEKVQKLAGLIKQLKAHANPRKATELIAEITSLKHPDVAGLLDAIEARQNSGGKRQKRGEL